MSDILKLVKVNYRYCDYLRKYDNKVSYNAGKKELRPFIGVLFKINNLEYFAPLSSPKPKHVNMRKAIDFLKIDDGKLGIVNFNNMIPVYEKNYELLDLSLVNKDKISSTYIKLLRKQLFWLNRHHKTLIKKSRTLYYSYINNTLDKGIKLRCCNFKLLEQKCMEYNKELITI